MSKDNPFANKFSISKVAAAILGLISVMVVKFSLLITLGWFAYCVSVLAITPTAILWNAFILFVSLQAGGFVVAFLSSKIMGTSQSGLGAPSPPPSTEEFAKKTSEVIEEIETLIAEIEKNRNEGGGGRMH